jgi:hypothetical protein
MSKTVRIVVALMSLMTVPAFAASGGACKYSDIAKLKEHLEKHVHYPATGKVVKQTCRKEMPDEFSAEELKCSDQKLKDTAEFKSPAEVMKALGVD